MTGAKLAEDGIEIGDDALNDYRAANNTAKGVEDANDLAKASKSADNAEQDIQAVKQAAAKAAQQRAEKEAVARAAAKKVAESAAGNAAGEGAGPQTLYHYTNEEGMQGILSSQKLKPSLKEVNPKDARYGNGQYLSDIKPGTYSNASLSSRFLRNPYQGARFSHYVELDVTGLNVVQGRPGVFVTPNEGDLNLAGRIVGWGAN